MFVILLIVFVFLVLVHPFIRYFVFHPFSCGKQLFLDVYDKIKHKRKNECQEFGKVVMFTAKGSKAFGSGKTLSMVRYLTWLYNKYNNLDVWDAESKSFVKQHIIIISNINLASIPYIPFKGREQFVNIDKLPHTEHDILVFCIDEAGFEFNSRNYKDNLPTDFLVRLLQVRHNKVQLLLTAQRFTFTDKVLRQICGVVTTCAMRWRIVQLQDYDAYALENCPNPEMIQPISTRYYLATDSLFASYDTNYNVEKLKDQLESGDLLDTSEILAKIGDHGGDPSLSTPKLRRRFASRKGR